MSSYALSEILFSDKGHGQIDGYLELPAWPLFVFVVSRTCAQNGGVRGGKYLPPHCVLEVPKGTQLVAQQLGWEGPGPPGTSRADQLWPQFLTVI
jgi:hypothetical protein